MNTENSLLQDYLITPYVGEFINTLTNSIYGNLLLKKFQRTMY
jgi:hypothetical protein